MSKVLSDARSASPSARALSVSSVALMAALPIVAGLGLPWPFLLVISVSGTLEYTLYRTAPTFVDIMRRVQLGPNTFSMIRQVAILVLLATSEVVATSWLVIFAIAMVTARGLHALTTGLQTYITSRRRLPVLTRNIDVSSLQIPDAVAPLWMSPQARLLWEVDLLLAAGALATCLAGSHGWLLAGFSAAIAVQLVRVAVLAVEARRNRHLKGTNRILRQVGEQLATDSPPEVAIYFTGSAKSIYQINMWLQTVERLDPHAMVIMREQSLYEQLAPTNLPVVCIPDNIHLMNFPMPNLRVALYPGNAGKNIHMLRIPGIAHVFIGHGDSDKPASFNPYSKVYTQIWTAGPAGRDRYRAAGIGVNDSAFREVGRPQLDDIRSLRQHGGPAQVTVMYAPTWEGWTADLTHCSLVKLGVEVVRRLLETGDIRILYRPHPLTGTRDSRMLKAHNTIVQMLIDANRSAGLPSGFERPDLAELEARRLSLVAPTVHADPAQIARDSSNQTKLGDAARELELRWNEQYWSGVSARQHHVVDTRGLPRLNDMFNECDLLITDVSSIISDFMASEKPYVVCNSSGLSSEDFRSRNPSTRAAYLFDPKLDNFNEVLDHLRNIRNDRRYNDPMSKQRRLLREYLLGPSEPTAMERFSCAIADVLEDGGGEKPPVPKPTGIEISRLCWLRSCHDPQNPGTPQLPNGRN